MTTQYESTLIATYGMLVGNSMASAMDEFPYEICTLKDYVLECRTHLSIVPCAGKEIQVCVYMIDQENLLHRFDRMEGYPEYYGRIQVRVEELTSPVWIYQMNSLYFDSNILPASIGYAQLCYDGYAQRGMNPQQLDNAFKTKGDPYYD